MSDYHVLEASDRGNSLKVAMHIPVPSGTNLVSKTFTGCLVEDTSISKVSVVASIATQEQDALTAGTLAERVVSLRTHKDLSNAVKRNRLDSAYNQNVTRVQNALRQRYWGWGFERDVT